MILLVNKANVIRHIMGLLAKLVLLSKLTLDERSSNNQTFVLYVITD